MSSPLVKIKNLKYSYSDNSVFEMSIKNFVLEKGERLLIYGESGLGKSTFLNLISGSIESQDGDIEIFLNGEKFKLGGIGFGKPLAIKFTAVLVHFAASAAVLLLSPVIVLSFPFLLFLSANQL